MKRRNTTTAAIVLVLLALAPLAAAAQTITLEIGAAVPANSPWDLGLRRLAAEWSRITGGRVQMVFPKSMVNASQQDIIQKTKLSLEGGLIETSGLYQIDKDWLFLSMPSVIRDESEFKAALAAALPILRARMADRYEVITVAQGGWLRLFSNRPLVKPEDLVMARVGVSSQQEVLMAQLQAIGARTVKSDASSLLTLFSNGGIDVSFTSPLYMRLLWSQFRQSVTHMSSFKLSPFFGALLVTKKAWASVPAEFKPAMLAAADKVAAEIAAEGIKLEDDAIAAMRRDGLTSPALSPAQSAAWDELFTGDRMKTMLSGWFTREITDKVFAAVAAARK